MVIRKIPIMRTNLGGLLIINLVLTFAIPGISIGGHIGGLVAGFLCGLVLMRPHRGPAPLWDMVVPFLLGVAGIVRLVLGRQPVAQQALQPPPRADRAHAGRPARRRAPPAATW